MPTLHHCRLHEGMRLTDGSSRMHELGNKRVKLQTEPPVQIKNPAAAEDLLGLAIDGAVAGQRLIFFCAWLKPALTSRR